MKQKVRVVSPYGYAILKGRVTKIKLVGKPYPFSNSYIVKYYYEIDKHGLYAEDLLTK